MRRGFINFLVIFLTIGHTIANFQMNLLNIYDIIAWSETILNDTILYYNNLKISDNNSSQILNKFFTEVDQVANDDHIFLAKINKKRYELFDMSDNKGDNSFYNFFWKSELPNHFKAVFYYYNVARSRTFGIANQSNNESLDGYFIKFVLKNSLSLPSTLEKIYELTVRSAHSEDITLMEYAVNDVKLNAAHNCDKFLSTQQLIFLFYHKLTINEMKGLTALTYVYSLLQREHKNLNYSKQITIAKQKFLQRMISYYELIKKTMALVSREIHRCDINVPERGVNFIEFIHYHRALLISASVLGTDRPGMAFYLCSTKCEDINHDFMGREFGIKIYNDKTINSQDLQICPADRGSNRVYSGWINQGRLYGHNETCSHQSISGNDFFWQSPGQCNICQCSVIQSKPRYDNDILRLSVSPQTSDIDNNMIVVGVKFVTYDKAIHLQIQQSKFLSDQITDNFTVWKKLDDDHSSLNTKLHYEALADFSGQLLLDNVMLPPKYAVTGVRFRTSHFSVSGFYLQVQGTPFDLSTGKLDPSDSIWFTGCNAESCSELYYKQRRIEIKMNDPDDPSRCSGYDYDEQTNKFIQFKHSSIVKDAGQSTVPYIDAQSVETYPPFPLSGIGLFYRGKEGCGGYIAPRIFTLDITQYTKYMNSIKYTQLLLLQKRVI